MQWNLALWTPMYNNMDSSFVPTLFKKPHIFSKINLLNMDTQIMDTLACPLCVRINQVSSVPSTLPVGSL